jgi:6-phosphogluconolactonase
MRTLFRPIAVGIGAILLFGIFTSAAAAQQFVYAARRGTDQLVGYNINLFGGLTRIPGSPFVAGAGANAVAVDRFNRFAFVTNEGSMNVSAFTINPFSGALTAVAGSPFALPSAPKTLTVDGSGRFLYVLHGAAISAFAIDPFTGALTTIAGSPFPAGQALVGLAADPFGRFLFTSDSVRRVAISFSIDPAAGRLTEASAVSGVQAPPVSVIADPLGRFAFVLQAAPNFVGSSQAFLVDPVTGALTVSGSGTAGSLPVSFAVEASGRFMYVAEGLAPATSGAEINFFTGSFGRSLGSFAGAGSLTADPTGRFVVTAGLGLLVNSVNPFTGQLSITSFVPEPGLSAAAVTSISFLALFVPH